MLIQPFLTPGVCAAHMDCREFLDRSLAFVDGTMDDAELVAMQRHVAECARCSQHDTALRRGLIVLRNLPTIEPSPNFNEKLQARIQRMHTADARAAMYRGPGMGAFLAVAVGVVTVGLLAAGAFEWSQPREVPVLAPMVATRPELPPLPVVNQAYVASASAGMPVWPTAMLAEQASAHLANAEYQFANWTR